MKNATRKDGANRLATAKRTRAGVLVATLGLTASIVASPLVRHETVRTPDGTAKRHWFQIGKASWYGSQFQGRKTATGEPFDMNALTCAHRTLPLGSWIRVTNLRNKKSAFVRVNDRGPYEPNKVVDLSYAAARRLGVKGLANVKIEEINPNDPALAEGLVAQLRMDDPALVSQSAVCPLVGYPLVISR